MSQGRSHWSNLAVPAKFFMVNAVAGVPWLLMIVHPSWMVLYAASAITVFLVYIEVFKKMSPRAYFRALGVRLVGRTKSTRSALKRTL